MTKMVTNTYMSKSTAPHTINKERKKIMKQTWEAVANLKVGDTLELKGTKKKRKILSITELDNLNVEIEISDLKFAICKHDIVAIFS